jgi:hypothetical protein
MKVFAVIHGGGNAVTEHSYSELLHAVPAHGMELVNRHLIAIRKKERLGSMPYAAAQVQQDPDSRLIEWRVLGDDLRIFSLSHATLESAVTILPQLDCGTTPDFLGRLILIA